MYTFVNTVKSIYIKKREIQQTTKKKFFYVRCASFGRLAFGTELIPLLPYHRVGLLKKGGGGIKVVSDGSTLLTG